MSTRSRRLATFAAALLLASPVVAAALLLASPAGAATIQTELFESDGDGIRYTLTGAGGFGTDNFFGLSSQGTLPAGFSGFEGTDFLAGRDLNDFSGGVPNPRAFDLVAVDTSGFSSVTVSILLAATPTTWESADPDFLRVWAVDADGVLPPVLLDAFVPVSASNSNLVNGSGTALGLAFQDFTWNAPAGMTNLIVRIETYSTGGAEAVGIDDIRIEGTPIPEPSSALILLSAAAWSAGALRRTPKQA